MRNTNTSPSRTAAGLKLARGASAFASWLLLVGSLILALQLAPALLHAQGATPEPAADPSADAQTDAKTDGSTPRAAMRGFLVACRSGDYALAATFMDLRRVAEPLDGPRLARHLKFVLDQRLWIDLDALSMDPAGDPADRMPNRDVVGSIESAQGPVPIWLERMRGGEWKLASRTVAAIPRLYDEYGLGPLGEVLPAPMFIQLGDVALWQWAALIALVVIAYVLASIVSNIGIRIAGRMVRRTQSELDDELAREAAAPISALLLLLFFWFGVLPLGLPVPAQALVRSLVQVLTIAALAWLAVRSVDVAARTFETRIRDRADTTVLTVIPVGRRVAKVFLLVIAVLAGLQNLGFNVLSVIAGLGVVGIGVALAAQTTFENFFGTISILVDQPVRRGDFCRFGDSLGTVEDIGLRSTRIRTLDRTILTVPNAEFSALRIENFGARDQIRFYTVLGLRYETQADQLRHALIGLKNLLLAHPRVTDDPGRVRFIGFGPHSLDLEIFCYVNTSDWNEFLAIREDLLLQIIDVVEASGTGFAFPSQTLYLGRDEGLDPERTRTALEEVRGLRQDQRLPLPFPSADQQQAQQGRLTYPPAGSVSLAPESLTPESAAEESGAAGSLAARPDRVR